ncbi:hypothetical protein SASPL_103649 [Salvia splendens]|uniref:Bet v I/Major latex protein domain-containing protein n=1 Tax=Salvia splendens TaxID=180675 RepID=A0A8X8YLD4_SALSN|nr:allergen Pet c 1-like [Salvia splendens]KAG6432076.1 hypothetical protein SASPL_103649 [Salvia splendens]
MRVAVIGGGVSGLTAAYVLAKEGVEVALYEKETSLGGHAKTTTVDGIPLDLDFTSFSQVMYPEVMELFETVGVDTEVSDISYSVSWDDVEWGAGNGLSGFIIDGDALAGALESITYHIKIVPTEDGGSICKNRSIYNTKGDVEISEEKIKEGKEKAMAMFKAIEAYVQANPDC